MSGTSSVPPVSFTDNGFVVPEESAVVTGLEADYNAAFDGNLNTAASTPAGQLIASTAAIIGDSNDQQVALFNGVDPAYASGRMQDAIARIYFLTRNPAQPSLLQVACGGLAGVPIPMGALVQDPSDNIWVCQVGGDIPSNGAVTLTFASQIAGPIPIPSEVSIYQVIPNWNTVSVQSGVVGNEVESRAAFEARRAASVAANGAGFLPAIAGAVGKVANVIDFFVTENSTSSPVTTGGVTLNPNSLYVCVAGGTQIDVATAIWLKKNPGCGYTGNTTVSVLDTNSGYSPPYPSYSVTFEVPTDIPVCMLVTLKNSSTVPSTVVSLVQAAVLKAFTGQDGGTRARIGSEIFASRFYSGIASLGTWAQIISIQVGYDASPAASFTGAIAGTALTVSGVTGTIAAGQFVYGTGVAPGTIIVSGSGTSWVVSVGQTVSSEAMSSVTANQNAITMNINQLPTLASADINVVLQ